MHKKKKKKEKHRKRDRSDSDSSSGDIVKIDSVRSRDSGASSSKSASLEQLRAERLKREKEERLKTERLMSKMKGETPQTDPGPSLSDRDRSYNSQFNPHLARKPTDYNNR